MSTGNWIVLGIWGFTQLAAIVGVYIRLILKIKEIDMKIDSNVAKLSDVRSSLHIHEQQNEKSFDKFEKKMDAIHVSISEIKEANGHEFGELKNLIIQRLT